MVDALFWFINSKEIVMTKLTKEEKSRQDNLGIDPLGPRSTDTTYDNGEGVLIGQGMRDKMPDQSGRRGQQNTAADEAPATQRSAPSERAHSSDPVTNKTDNPAKFPGQNR